MKVRIYLILADYSFISFNVYKIQRKHNKIMLDRGYSYDELRKPIAIIKGTREEARLECYRIGKACL
jgi:hypothetical protein